jgi:hypothetical protein
LMVHICQQRVPILIASPVGFYKCYGHGLTTHPFHSSLVNIGEQAALTDPGTCKA